jgi:hypothetical protein
MGRALGTYWTENNCQFVPKYVANFPKLNDIKLRKQQSELKFDYLEKGTSQVSIFPAQAVNS